VICGKKDPGEVSNQAEVGAEEIQEEENRRLEFL
jgi:hypothetical protein